MQLQTHATTEVEVAPERVFDFLSGPDVFVRVLRPFGPIPGLTAVELLDGATVLAPGVRRRVHMTDDTTLEEQIVDHDRPRRQRYRWGHPPQGPFGLLIRGAEADWTFAESPRGARIDWHYTFELTSPLAAPVALLVLAIFKRWMLRGLAQVQQALGPRE